MSSNAGKRAWVIVANKENPIDLSKSAGGPAKKLKASRALPRMELPAKLDVPLPVSGDAAIDRSVIGRACRYPDLVDCFGAHRKSLTSPDAMRCINEIVDLEAGGVTAEVVRLIVNRFRKRVDRTARRTGMDRTDVTAHFLVLSKQQ